jgi:surfeit locus 1 family protein
VLKWDGGELGGVIAPGGRLVADQPLPGLEASARPDPRDVPNNHWSYAVQWFLFALTALVIYTLALRKRLAAKDGAG